MREILFRGKNVRTGKWVYGSLILVGEYCCILEPEDESNAYDYPYLDPDLGIIDGQATPVDPKTVGQFTGLFDKNDKKIFEGDIVKTKYGRLCVVKWFSSQVHNGWDLKAVTTVENCVHTKPPTVFDLYKKDNLEVVGNIHDNPEERL